MVKEFKLGDRVSYNKSVYTVLSVEGDALLVSRPGVRDPMTIPGKDSFIIHNEGRTDDFRRLDKKVNG